MVNLDFILCANSNDPAFKYTGKWYYLLADFYIGFGSYCLRAILIFVAYYTKRLGLMIMGKDSKSKREQDKQVDKKKAKGE